MAVQLAHDRLPEESSRNRRLEQFWPLIAALAIGLTSILLLFRREVMAAIEVWDASTAYSHCYLVLPMALYLLWERRDAMFRGRAAPDWRFALGAIPLTIAWLIAERLGIMEARQLMAVAGAELLFLTVLGLPLFKTLSGPLLYLFFLVPFGAFLTPALQQFTARFSIIGLDLLGIPNFSDGFTIETPAGIFFVAEACAGLRFLIAAIAFGVFYSLLTYTSFVRRSIFIGASIIVPIIANGFRALGIVVLGQVLGSAEAAAADHIIYGWVFFSLVMLLLIAGGHLFRDAERPLEAETPPVSMNSSRSLVWSVAGVVLLLGIGPALAGLIDLTSTPPVLPATPSPIVAQGCSLQDQAEGSSASKHLLTIACDAQSFQVSVEAFAARSTSSALIAERRRVTQEIGAENAASLSVDLPEETGHWTIVQTTDPNRLTAYASWIDGLPVSSNMAARIAQAHDSVFGAAYVPALVTISTAEPANGSLSQRKATLDRLTGLLREQSDLNSKMAVLTRVGN